MFVKFLDYDCKLSTRALVEIESMLKQNPLTVITQTATGELPKLTDLLVILWCSMKQYNHGIKKEDIYDIFDRYCAEGGSIASLTEVVVDLFMKSGILGKEDEKEDKKDGQEDEKN